MAAIGRCSAGIAAVLLLFAMPSPSRATGGEGGLLRLDFILPSVGAAGRTASGHCPQASDAEDVVVCGRRVRGLSQRVAPRPRQAGDRVLGEPQMASDVMTIGSTGCSTVGPLQGCGRVNLLAVAVRAAELIYRKIAGVPDEQPDWARMTAEMLPLDER